MKGIRNNGLVEHIPLFSSEDTVVPYYVLYIISKVVSRSREFSYHHQLYKLKQ